MEQRERITRIKKVMLDRLKKIPNRRLVVFLVALPTLLVLGLTAWWLYSNYGYTGNAQQISEYRKDYLELKKDKPNSDQQTVKADYYQLLASKAAKAGDYKGAVNAFEERKKVLGDKMPAIDFLELAIFYCRMDDKDQAIEAIQEGQSSKNASSNDKLRLEGSHKSINEQGCGAWLSPLDQQ